MADDDWGAVVTATVRQETRDQTEEPSTKQQLENEWLVATLDNNSYYSVRYPAQRQREDGTVEACERTDTFQVRALAHAKKRPKHMPTVEDKEDVAVSSPLALQVQFLDVWDFESPSRVPGCLIVFRCQIRSGCYLRVFAISNFGIDSWLAGTRSSHWPRRASQNAYC